MQKADHMTLPDPNSCLRFRSKTCGARPHSAALWLLGPGGRVSKFHVTVWGTLFNVTASLVRTGALLAGSVEGVQVTDKDHLLPPRLSVHAW